MKYLTALPVCLLVATVCVFAASAMNETASALEDSDCKCARPSFMSRADIPGLGLARVSKDKIQVNVYGDAKVGEQCAKEDTVFEAASLTKPVVAYLVMRLVERDSLELDDKLIDLLPDLPLPKNDPRSKQVTVRMALAHMSGLEGPDDQLLTFAEDPGTTFRYYPAGYRLVQRIVEHLEQTTLQELAEREVFEPLGMKSSTLVYRIEIQDRLATRHNILSKPIEKDRDPQRPANAAASLLTTTGDYARFLQAMLKPQGISAESVEAMLEPQIDVAETQGKVAWGIGWGLEPSRGTFFHYGDDGAAKCFTIGSRSSNDALVYFTNSFNGMAIARDMTRRLLPGDSPAVEWLGYHNWDSPFRLARRDILKAFVSEGADAGMSMFNQYEQRYPEIDMAKIANWMSWLLELRELHAARIKILDWQISKSPNDIDLHLKLASSQQAVGNYGLALQALQQSRNGADETLLSYIDAQIEWAEGSLAAKNQSKTLMIEDSTLVGTYGVRSVTSDEGDLFYQREGLPRTKLQWMYGTTFALEGNSTYRIRFDLEQKPAAKLTIFDAAGNYADSIRSDG